jgi:translation initiation factor 3 subunit B
MVESNSFDTVAEDEEISELSFANVIVITNLPVGVPPEKQAKLESFLSKVISSDPSSDIIDIHIPLDSEKSTTLGVAIVTLSDEAKVPPTLERVDGFEVSRGQALKAFPFEVAESILEDALISKDEEAAAEQDILIINRTTQRNWLVEEPRMEQLVTRFDDETEISWVDPLDPNPKLYYGGDREKVSGKKWCDLNVEFSPNGSYLITYHGPGVAIWSGKHFGNKTRFEHQHVAGAIFSPDEEFVLTWRHALSPEDREVVKVWRVLNGELLRSFGHTKGVLTTEFNESGFLWSPSSKYICRVVHGAIFVYETASMKLMTDLRSGQPAALRYQNVKVVSWCPVEDTLAIWTPEGSNEPASLIVVDPSSRQEICAKKLFSTGDSPAEIFWHPDGDYIALKASRLLTRSKKTGKTVFDIIRLREKLCPSETIETFGSVLVSAAWEPVTNGRLAVVVGEEKKVAPSSTNPTGTTMEYKAKFYTVSPNKAIEEPGKEHVLPLLNASYNTVSWSPNGQHFVLMQGPTPSKAGTVEVSAFAPTRKAAMTGNMNGEMIFYSCTASGLELLRKDEHVNCNKIEWDPSGRFLITAVVLNVAEKNAPSYKMEQYSGYSLWTFQGRNLKKMDGVRMWNVQWRPHVAGLLSQKEKKALMKQMREKSQLFDEQDKAIKNAKKDSFMSGFRAKQRVFDDEMAAIDGHFAEALADFPKWATIYKTPSPAAA